MALAGLAAALGVSLSLWMFFDLEGGTGRRPARKALDELPALPDLKPAQADDTRSADQRLSDELRLADTDNLKLALLDDFSRNAEATSTSAALRNAMVIDPSGEVRVRAFEVAKELAVKEGRQPLTAILKQGIGNPHAEVRRAGLRGCRDNPRYELMQDLLKIVEQGGSDRSLAIQALAFMDDPVAHQAVLDAAQSKEIPREQRIQAIALLSRTRLEDGVSYLQQLATGDDMELCEYAMEALRIWQESAKAK